jgi:hypothetical protein
MNRVLLQYRVVLFQLQALRSVFLVLGGDVTAGAGLSTVFVFSAFQDNLNTISFLGHFLKNLMFRSFRRRLSALSPHCTSHAC